MRLMVSSYHGVVAARGRWEARVDGQTRGRFDSEVLAARCVAKHRGVTVKSLKRSVPPRVARRMFVAAYKVFRKYRPGDYESMVQQEMDAARMFQQVLPCIKCIPFLIRGGVRVFGCMSCKPEHSKRTHAHWAFFDTLAQARVIS